MDNDAPEPTAPAPSPERVAAEEEIWKEAVERWTAPPPPAPRAGYPPCDMCNEIRPIMLAMRDAGEYRGADGKMHTLPKNGHYTLCSVCYRAML